MGDVRVVAQVMPASSEVDMDGLKKGIKNTLGDVLSEVEEVPFVFGMKSLNIILLLPDAEGGTEIIEEKLMRVDGVGGVNFNEITRLP